LDYRFNSLEALLGLVEDVVEVLENEIELVFFANLFPTLEFFACIAVVVGCELFD